MRVCREDCRRWRIRKCAGWAAGTVGDERYGALAVEAAGKDEQPPVSQGSTIALARSRRRSAGNLIGVAAPLVAQSCTCGIALHRQGVQIASRRRNSRSAAEFNSAIQQITLASHGGEVTANS